MSDYLSALDRADEQLVEAARWQAAYARQYLDRDPSQVGETRPPLRIAILDTMRVVEAALHDTADQIASSVQRPAMRPAPATWPTADRERRNALARADAADPRRWRWTGRRRPVPYTALWLLARVENQPGPFRGLTVPEAEQVGVVSAGAAERVERALDITAQKRTLAQRCPCGGEIDMHGGEGRPPVAHCAECGRIWTEDGLIAT